MKAKFQNCHLHTAEMQWLETVYDALSERHLSRLHETWRIGWETEVTSLEESAREELVSLQFPDPLRELIWLAGGDMTYNFRYEGWNLYCGIWEISLFSTIAESESGPVVMLTRNGVEE